MFLPLMKAHIQEKLMESRLKNLQIMFLSDIVKEEGF